MNKSYDFNAETPEAAARRRALAAALQQVDLLPNEQYRMPSTPSSGGGLSPEMLKMMMKNKGAGKSEAPPQPMVGDFPTTSPMSSMA